MWNTWLADWCGEFVVLDRSGDIHLFCQCSVYIRVDNGQWFQTIVRLVEYSCESPFPWFVFAAHTVLLWFLFGGSTSGNARACYNPIGLNLASFRIPGFLTNRIAVFSDILWGRTTNILSDRYTVFWTSFWFWVLAAMFSGFTLTCVLWWPSIPT